MMAAIGRSLMVRLTHRCIWRLSYNDTSIGWRFASPAAAAMARDLSRFTTHWLAVSTSAA